MCVVWMRGVGCVCGVDAEVGCVCSIQHNVLRLLLLVLMLSGELIQIGVQNV